MGQELQVPAAFNKGVAKVFQGHVNPQDDNLSDGIGQSYPVIAYKGKVWALRYRGERKLVTRPDDGTQSGHLDVVILDQAKSKSKSYYKAYDPNGTSEGERPICASMDGIVPDLDVVQKQSDTCALCPRNVWKTDAQTGRKGRECTDYKRLAVLVMPSQTTPAFGHPLMEPMFLRVPPDSLNSLAIMGDTMSNQGYHFSTYLTRITFDPLKAHPCMVFRPVQPLSDQEGEVVLELRKHASIPRITGGDVVLQGPREVQQLAPAGAVPTGLTAPVTQTVQRQQPERQQTIEETRAILPSLPENNEKAGEITTGLTLAAPKKGRPAGSKNKPKPEVEAPVDNPAFAQASTQLSQQAEPDEGGADQSEDELDAEIAKLIASQ